jgi:hypothetical protein
MLVSPSGLVGDDTDPRRIVERLDEGGECGIDGSADVVACGERDSVPDVCGESGLAAMGGFSTLLFDLERFGVLDSAGRGPCTSDGFGGMDGPRGRAGFSGWDE